MWGRLARVFRALRLRRIAGPTPAEAQPAVDAALSEGRQGVDDLRAQLRHLNLVLDRVERAR